MAEEKKDHRKGKRKSITQYDLGEFLGKTQATLSARKRNAPKEYLLTILGYALLNGIEVDVEKLKKEFLEQGDGRVSVFVHSGHSVAYIRICHGVVSR